MVAALALAHLASRNVIAVSQLHDWQSLAESTPAKRPPLDWRTLQSSESPATVVHNPIWREV